VERGAAYGMWNYADTLTFTGAGDAGILAGTSVESMDRIAERLKAK
jgi:hypothetical protein